MEISEILQQLERFQEAFPREAVAQAVARREEITPELLAILERVIADPAAAAGDIRYSAHLFALYLLARFREPRAYPVVLRLAALPEEDVEDLLGDAITESLGNILASVCQGDDTGIRALIENPQLGDTIRTAGLHALVSLIVAGQRTRDEVVQYFKSLFHTLDREADWIWTDLAMTCADLCPLELYEEISQAYEDDLIDPGEIPAGEMREALDAGVEDAMSELPSYGYGLVEDVEESMGWMAGFHPEQPETYHREGPKIGRNDPCPCGSGKKFKNCCGA